MKQFRALFDGECRILLIRHEVNGPNHGCLKNQVPRNKLLEIKDKGAYLREVGLKIDLAFTSPAPRAFITLYNLLVGYGELLYIETCSLLGDLALAGIDSG